MNVSIYVLVTDWKVNCPLEVNNPGWVDFPVQVDNPERVVPIKGGVYDDGLPSNLHQMIWVLKMRRRRRMIQVIINCPRKP